MNELEELPIPLLTWYRENARVLPVAERPHALPGLDVRGDAPADPGGGGAGPTSTGFWRRCPRFGAGRRPEEQLLKLWKGWAITAGSAIFNGRPAGDGAGRRAAARVYGALRCLAGVGDYTAGAIASIALRHACAAVDGNVLRVMAG